MTTSPPTPHPETDLLARYRAASSNLTRDASDRDAQQQAVLCLARLGATDLAELEYARYGLAEVETEDAQSLLARIHKDLFLRGGEAALERGRRAAALYDAAHTRTGGTYSGINAATMLLLTGGDADAVRARARTLLDSLEEAEPDSASSAYYIPATRAECYLLLGDVDRADFALQRAVAADPLNYAAHATTLKQFHLITHALAQTDDWLTDYAPPRPVCFAGHLWAEAIGPNETALSIQLRDLIQRRDIGYAYGALAAGADILIAEACLAEGVSLHLVLPGGVESFKARSVVPSGESWGPRFEVCLAQAASVLILPNGAAGSDMGSMRRAAEISAGQAILRAAHMSRDPEQLLVLDATRPQSLSHALRDQWQTTGYKTITAAVALPETKTDHPARSNPAEPLALMSYGFEGPQAHELSDISEIEGLLHQLSTAQSEATLALDLAGRTGPGLETALETAVPGARLLSESLAALVALSDPQNLRLAYAGFDLASDQHLYSLPS